MYKIYAKAVLAGTRDINNLQGAMREKVEQVLAEMLEENGVTDDE